MEHVIREPMRARKAFSLLGLSLVVICAVRFGLSFLTRLLLKRLGFSENLPDWLFWAANYLPFYLIAIPCGLLLMRAVPAMPREKTRLGAKNFFLFLLMCFPLMYIGNLVGNLLSAILSGGTAENALNDIIFDNSILKCVVVVLLAPCIEEFVFRKQLIDRASVYGEEVAILFSGLTFGLFHMNLYQFFYAAALGMLFAYVYVRTRQVRYTIFMHIIINFLGSVVAPIFLSKLDIEAISAGQLDPSMLPALLGIMAYSMALMGLSAAGLVLLILKVKKFLFLPAPAGIPRQAHFKTVYCNVGMIAFVAVCIGMSVYSLLG